MSNIRQYLAEFLGPFKDVESFHLGGGTAPGFGQFGSMPNLGAAGSRVILSAPSSPGSKEYQLCQIDSGATSATPTGAIAQGQLMYWKNRSAYLVTNDVRFSDTYNGTTRNGVQSVAGVLVTPTTGATGVPAVPGDWVFLQTKGRCNLILSQELSPALGDFAVPFNADATHPQIAKTAVGSAPADTVVGRFMSATVTNNVAQVDLQLPEIP
jgi:hypothetical protein